ncbi:MAG: glutamate-cysteine ligase family protein [Gemmatimonadota bacterium]
MGEKAVSRDADAERLRVFTQYLLRDVRALERLLESDLIESGVRRIGCEQELFLVDSAWRPAPMAVELLQRLEDPRVTSEIGRFNLECNLPPLVFGGDCLRRFEVSLNELLDDLRSAADPLGVRIVLTGILPTLRKSDLTLDNMVPEERYFALNEALTRLRGEHYDLRIKGTDDLNITHESVMLEACNASFQVHFQVSPAEFARFYNIALAATAPVLAAGVNSPLLLGRRLWHETRIAVFQQSVDTRSSMPEARDISPRVSFGRSWVDSSVLEIFREDIARFKVLLGSEIEEDPFEALEAGRAPKLRALQLHNSTVYRWNRACYGVADGVGHLRIENRVLPSGPTPVDEIANAAFWFGLVSGLAEEHEDIRTAIEFDDVRTNFVAAARLGLDAHLAWLGGETRTAADLIRERLLPRAPPPRGARPPPPPRRGLEAGGIDRSDVDRYLGVIEDRVRSRQTGARWLLGSLAAMKDAGSLEERLGAVTAATVARQATGEPAHTWALAEHAEAGCWKPAYVTVGQYMTTDLLTVNEDEPIDLVANLMDWHRIHHVPVEDNKHRLVGLVSHRPLLRFLASDECRRAEAPIPVSDVMQRELVTAEPDTGTLEAIETMRSHRISCLPVVRDGHLIGMVTEHDFMRIAGQLLEEMLRE